MAYRLNLRRCDYPEDVDRIVAVLWTVGFACTRKQADKLWRMYSRSVCAGWIGLPDSDEQILDCLEDYIV